MHTNAQRIRDLLDVVDRDISNLPLNVCNERTVQSGLERKGCPILSPRSGTLRSRISWSSTSVSTAFAPHRQ